MHTSYKDNYKVHVTKVQDYILYLLIYLLNLFIVLTNARYKCTIYMWPQDNINTAALKDSLKVQSGKVMNMEEKIKDIVKELFGSGMTLDEVIDYVSSIASREDYKRFCEK